MRLESHRVNEVRAPIIPEVADLIEANPGTISLGQGVAYFPPPETVLDGVARFASIANHHYQPVEGIPQLRDAISAKIESENQIDASEYAIVVTAGSNMGFLNAVLATCDPGDEVIILYPWYFNHEMAIRIANCVPVSVAVDSEHQPIVGAIKRAITSRTRAVVTISPNNPTGAVYDFEKIRAINQLCEERDLYHISDEAYEYFVYDDVEHYSPASAASASLHTISLFSMSKSFGFASWRIGYMLVPKHLFLAMRKIQDTNLICAPVVSQYAAVECLKVGFSYCRDKILHIGLARDHLAKALNELEGVNFSSLDGAFYALIELPDTRMTDMDIVKVLIERFGVAVIPGQAFGIEDRCCLRASYGALAQDICMQGIDRLTDGLRLIISS